MEFKIGYQKEVQIKSQPNGTVFACGQELQVKICETELMVLGTGEKHIFTPTCMAFPVRGLTATL
jgi:hypothetical protein